jgi:hypothetical protein
MKDREIERVAIEDREVSENDFNPPYRLNKKQKELFTAPVSNIPIFPVN